MTYIYIAAIVSVHCLLASHELGLMSRLDLEASAVYLDVRNCRFHAQAYTSSSSCWSTREELEKLQAPNFLEIEFKASRSLQWVCSGCELNARRRSKLLRERLGIVQKHVQFSETREIEYQHSAHTKCTSRCHGTHNQQQSRSLKATGLTTEVYY
jgi:hypothetical protein